MIEDLKAIGKTPLSEKVYSTLVATMLPYSLIFLIGWTVLLALWMVLGLPLGPGVSLML